MLVVLSLLLWVVDVLNQKVSVKWVNHYWIVMHYLLLDEHLSSMINPIVFTIVCFLCKGIFTVNWIIMRMVVRFDQFWKQVKKILVKLNWKAMSLFIYSSPVHLLVIHENFYQLIVMVLILFGWTSAFIENQFRTYGSLWSCTNASSWSCTHLWTSGTWSFTI